MNTNGFQKPKSGWLIVWEVVDADEDVVAVFKDAKKAAVYALDNGFYGVQMSLYKADWKFETKD